MTTIRVMTYNIQRCRGADARIDPSRILEVISAGSPDLVALQEVNAVPGQDHLHFLAERLGMRCYCGSPGLGINALLSYYPLRGVQDYDLGGGGSCLRADADLGGKRLHLFNLRLDFHPEARRRQIGRLLGPTLLGNRSLTCPTLVVGDFADLFWAPGNLGLTLELRKVRRPLWNATFPSSFPLFDRDRAYLRGNLRVLDSAIERCPLARQASSHLPLILTLEVIDPRNYLRVEKLSRNRMEIAPG